MENYNKKEQTENSNPHKNKVHKVLAHSYLIYLLFFLIGVCLNIIFNFKIFYSSWVPSSGILFLIFATILIFWAQITSRNLNKENITKETFLRGPYRFTRMPTNFGLFFLMLGFGMIANSFFITLFAPASFFIAKFIFIKKQERILEKKYGTPYLEYKKIVKF